MIHGSDLQNMAVASPPRLTDRQHEVVSLIAAYLAVAHEMPSAGWLARRLAISRQRAQQHLDVLRTRGWLDRSR